MGFTGAGVLDKGIVGEWRKKKNDLGEGEKNRGKSGGGGGCHRRQGGDSRHVNR